MSFPYLDDLASYFAAQGLGTVGTTIFKYDNWDTSTASYLNLIASGGLPVVHGLGDTFPDMVDRLTLQVAVVSTSPMTMLPQIPPYTGHYTDAMDRIRQAYDLTKSLSNVRIGTGHYEQIQALQPPAAVDEDEQARARYAFNLLCHRRPIPS